MWVISGNPVSTLDNRSLGYQKNPALFAERRAYEASRSGEEKAAFGRMLENTMVSTPASFPC